MVDEKGYKFQFNISLRIFGDGLDFDFITSKLGIEPTVAKRKGEQFDFKGRGTKRKHEVDTWIYKSPIVDAQSFDEHLEHFVLILGAKTKQIKELSTKYELDLFCGYQSDCDHAGFSIKSDYLKFFVNNNLDLNVSTIII